jgi:Transposase DDE domain
VLRPPTPALQKSLSAAFDAQIRSARRHGRLNRRRHPLAAADSTGLESQHCSTYYGQRCGRRKRRFPKVSQLVDVQSHLALAAVVERGPGPDDPAFHPLARQAHRRHRFPILLADAGYDGEDHHQFLRQRLGVCGIMPPTRGRPAQSRDHQPDGPHRRAMQAHWPILKPLYGQRWQVETRFSMEKRLLGSALRSRLRRNQDREAALRPLTLNFMILEGDP